MKITKCFVFCSQAAKTVSPQSRARRRRAKVDHRGHLQAHILLHYGGTLVACLLGHDGGRVLEGTLDGGWQVAVDLGGPP